MDHDGRISEFEQLSYDEGRARCPYRAGVVTQERGPLGTAGPTTIIHKIGDALEPSLTKGVRRV